MKRTRLYKRSFTPAFIILFLILVTGCQSDPAILFPGFDEPQDPDPVDALAWKNVGPGLQGSYGSTNIRYSRSLPPVVEYSDNLEVKAWKGEVVSAQIALWSATDIEKVCPRVSSLTDDQGNEISNELIQIRPVRYVMTDEFSSGCGYRSADTIPAHLAADILDTLTTFNIPANSTRPLWITISIPQKIESGEYSGAIRLETPSDTTIHLTLSLEIQDRILPDPSEWSFHLDLWQNPFAVARYHNVEVWSQEHLDLLRPILVMLADAGQKCITTSIVDKPWGGQTYDPFESMIIWIRNSDGRWEYDYHIFDLYVSFAMECGITHQINCYSMVPWENKIMYLDEDSSEFVTVEAIPGTVRYEELWKPFLYDFRAHLMEMGWLDKTTIALDERGLEDMKNMFAFIHKTVPEFKVTMAGHYFEEINSNIYDFSYGWRQIKGTSYEMTKERKAKGQITTYYVACGIPKPNNFTFSSPAESTYEGWFAAAMGFDGFLRWAYNSWVEDPLKDSRFRTWPAGDTYFVYPGPRSSIRFEKLKEGIRDYEKIRILRSTLKNSADPELGNKLKELESLLEEIRNTSDISDAISIVISKGKKLIDEISLI